MQPVQQVPHTIQRLASRYQLGELQEIYVPGRERWLTRLPGLFALLVGAAILYYFYMQYADFFSALPTWEMLFVPLIGCGWLLVGLWIICAPWFSRRQHVYVYQDGLICATRQAEVIRWSQLERLWKDVRIARAGRRSSSYVVRRNDHAFFVFKSDLLDNEKLGARLEEEITRRLLPRAIAAYEAGDAVLFDDVAISQRWLRVREGSKKLAWREFAGIQADAAGIELYKKGVSGPWTTLKVAAIPNVGVLSGLIQHAQSETELAASPQIVSYRAGIPLTFGPLTINQQGIAIKNASSVLPWSEIAAIGVGESEVIIRRKDSPNNWYAYPLWMIPDPAGLKELLSYILHA